jgi:hypothetical protein
MSKEGARHEPDCELNSSTQRTGPLLHGNLRQVHRMLKAYLSNVVTAVFGVSPDATLDQLAEVEDRYPGLSERTALTIARPKHMARVAHCP